MYVYAYKIYIYIYIFDTETLKEKNIYVLNINFDGNFIITTRYKY